MDVGVHCLRGPPNDTCHFLAPWPLCRILPILHATSLLEYLHLEEELFVGRDLSAQIVEASSRVSTFAL